jgi:hypothetical protein
LGREEGEIMGQTLTFGVKFGFCPGKAVLCQNLITLKTDLRKPYTKLQFVPHREKDRVLYKDQLVAVQLGRIRWAGYEMGIEESDPAKCFVLNQEEVETEEEADQSYGGARVRRNWVQKLGS